jgi:DNA-binding transcriptional LysR family regulator
VDNAGITFVFEHDADEALRNGQIEVLLPEFEIDPVPIHLVHVSRNLMPIKLRHFIDFAAPKLRESLSRFGKQKRA